MTTSLHKTVVIDIVALTQDLIQPHLTPFIYSYLYPSGHYPPKFVCDIEPVFPAVTCTAQTTYLTGTSPADHGILGNCLFDRQMGEWHNWHQSANLIRVPRLYQLIKQYHPGATTFSSFWWFPMGDPYLDYVITPRPQYLADGGKLPDIYTKPESLRHSLQNNIGPFPLHKFWGPNTDIHSTRWIVSSTMLVDQSYNPTFTTVYLPHLDYCLQKTSTDPNHPLIQKALGEIDKEVRRLVHYYNHHHDKPHVILLSEYGIQPVQRPIHINKILRSADLISIRKENGGETIDPYTSIAFSIPDHQIAHVYINDINNPRSNMDQHNNNDNNVITQVQELLQTVPGIKYVLRGRDKPDIDLYYDKMGQWRISDGNQGIYSRVGDLIVIAEHDTWFTYYYWEQDTNAPDFAYTINIHRKPGYDPVEMYYVYHNSILGWLYLLMKYFIVYILRIRTIVDGTRFDANRIQGSHGVTLDLPRQYWPIFATNSPHVLMNQMKDNKIIEDESEKDDNKNRLTKIRAEEVAGIIWKHIISNDQLLK